MDCIFEILLQLFAEFFVGAGFELIAEGIGRFVGGLLRVLGVISDVGFDFDLGQSQSDTATSRRRRIHLGEVILWALAGAAFGFVSLAIIPHPLIHAPILHAINLTLTPIAMATAMVFAGGWLTKVRDTEPRRSPMNHFACAYAFALVYLLVRFFFAR